MMAVPIMVIGDSWGREEDQARSAFVGKTGRFLRALMNECGINPRSAEFTNVFNLVASIESLTGKKPQGLRDWAPILKGKYCLKMHEDEIKRLEREIAIAQPNVILALGPAALWFLTNEPGQLERNRGVLFASRPIAGRTFKCIATYPPSSIFREWALKPIVMADLIKAAKETGTTEFSLPPRHIWIEPALDDMFEFEARYMQDTEAPWGIDIETAFGTVTEIGFAPSPSHAIVIPFFSRTSPTGSYWATAADEHAAWNWVAMQLARSRKPVFQNGLYDLNYLWRTLGLTVPHAGHDTMLLHHALQPEMRKSLGFLASLYANLPSWKAMRKGGGTLKREDD
jgi:uracil-DNA glycosylase